VYYDNFWIESTAALIGEQGPQGIQGEPGLDGTNGIDATYIILSSVNNPQPEDGSNGDLWIVYV
jgi:hypothetical protein